MATPKEVQSSRKESPDSIKLLPLKPVEDLSLEGNKHPKELAKTGEPLTPEKQQQIEASAKEIQKTCKNIVDHICGCPFHLEDIQIGEANLDTANFVKPNTIYLQQQGLKLKNALESLSGITTNLAPPQTPYAMEVKYKSQLVETVKEDVSRIGAPFNKVNTTIFAQDVSLPATQQLLDDTVDLIRNAQNVLIQIDKLKTADTINWPLEEAKAEQKRQAEQARRAHEEEIRPLKAEKSVIDKFDGAIKGFATLQEKLLKAEKLTDPALQKLPKYIRHTKDGYEPDPLVSEDDLMLVAAGPIGIAGVVGIAAIRAISRKANTVKELNPERPTKDQISTGLRELAGEITSLKRETEFLMNYPTTRNADTNWRTIQAIDALKKAAPPVMPILSELEDLPNKQETWNLATIRAAMLRAENSIELQQIIQECSELDNIRKNLDAQITPPAPTRRPYDPYGGYPNPYPIQSPY